MNCPKCKKEVGAKQALSAALTHGFKAIGSAFAPDPRLGTIQYQRMCREKFICPVCGQFPYVEG